MGQQRQKGVGRNLAARRSKKVRRRAGKVKRIYRKRMIKRWNSEYSERRIQDKQEGKAPIKMIEKKLIINNLTRNLSIKIRQSQ